MLGFILYLKHLMLESGQVRIFTGSKESFADVIYYESSSIRYMWVGGWGWVEDFW